MKIKIFIIVLIVVIAVYLLIEQSCQKKGTNPVRYSGAFESLESWSLRRAYPLESIPNKALYDAFQYSKNQLSLGHLEKSYLPDPWYSIGPHNQGGRMLTLAFNPQNPNTIYVGSASGGLWRSYSAGRGASAWERVSTGFPILGVSAIEFAPGDSNTIYIGTGEVYNYKQTGENQAAREMRGTYGMGVLKSTDGGATWLKSLDWSYNQERGIWAVKVNPLNPNTVWAATTEGVFKSTNAGESWLQVHDVIMAMDLAVNHADTNIVFVSCGNFRSQGFGIYRTTDSGESWLRLSDGLPQTFAGKAMLHIYETNPKVVFASIGNGFSVGVGNASWLCKSEDNGDNWTIISTEDYSLWQGWYSHNLAVHPTNTNEIYAAGIALWKTTDGGANLTQLSTFEAFGGQIPAGAEEGPPSYIHGDFHDVVYHPTNHEIVYFVTDAGIWRTINSGQTFESCNGGLQTTQFYNGFASSQLNSNLAVGGLQDNATSIYKGSADWSKFHLVIARGDGGWNAIDPRDDNIIYSSNWRLEIYKSTDRGESYTRIAPPGFSAGTTVFEAPFVLGFDNPDIIYGGRNIVYKSTTGGNSWEATNNNTPLDGNPVLSMAISQQSSNVVYAATAPFFVPASVFKTIDGGDNWHEITEDLPDRFPTDLAVDPTNDKNVYITFSGFETSHLFKSTNGGDTWQDIGINLPDVPASAVIVDPFYPDHIYFGNDITVYLSTNGGDTWQEFSEGLPEAMLVVDLSISGSNRKLRAVTHGNGVYERDLLGDAATGINKNESIISNFVLEQNYPNPFNAGTIITYSLPKAASVNLRIYNIDGQEIRTLIGNKTKTSGKHQARWDGKDNQGRNVASGVYIYQLRVGDFVDSKRMILMK